MRNSVKQFVNTHGDHLDFISPDMYDAAKYFAKDTVVEEQFFKTNNDTAMLLKQRQDRGIRVSVCYLNNSEKSKVAHESKPAERKNEDQGRSRSITPEKRKSYKNDNRQPLTCYNC